MEDFLKYVIIFLKIICTTNDIDTPYSFWKNIWFTLSSQHVKNVFLYTYFRIHVRKQKGVGAFETQLSYLSNSVYAQNIEM